MRSILTALFAVALFTRSSMAGTPQVTLPDTNIYASIVIVDDQGKPETFTHVEVREVEPDAITIAHSTGGYRVPFEKLPKAWQERYGLDADSAAAYRSEQEVAAQARAEEEQAAKEKAKTAETIDDGSLRIRVDKILEKTAQGTIIEASQLSHKMVSETRTNNPAGIKGPTEYSRNHEDPYHNRRVTTSHLTSNPGTKLEKKTATAPNVSTVQREVEDWHPFKTKIVLVEMPDLAKNWTGQIYPCGSSGEGYPRYATKPAVALAWKDRKPGMSMVALKRGFIDAVMAPAKAFHLNGMSFADPTLRNLTYWLGIVLGTLVYVLIAAGLVRR